MGRRERRASAGSLRSLSLHHRRSEAPRTDLEEGALRGRRLGLGELRALRRSRGRSRPRRRDSARARPATGLGCTAHAPGLFAPDGVAWSRAGRTAAHPKCVGPRDRRRRSRRPCAAVPRGRRRRADRHHGWRRGRNEQPPPPASIRCRRRRPTEGRRRRRTAPQPEPRGALRRHRLRCDGGEHRRTRHRLRRNAGVHRQPAGEVPGKRCRRARRQARRFRERLPVRRDSCRPTSPGPTGRACGACGRRHRATAW